MTDMILIYITCENEKQAREIGVALLKKRLSACFNILPNMLSCYLWPAQSGTIEEKNEAILIVKSIESKFEGIEYEVTKLHSYDTPCIIAIPVRQVSKRYYEWIIGEVGDAR